MGHHLSPLRYPGGKAALAPVLAAILTRNDLHDGTVIEPYAGGAGASLSLMMSEFATDLVLNDIDRRIYSFWRAVVNQADELIERIKRVSVSMKEWHRCRRVYEAPSNHSQLEVAFATFFLNRVNRSGILLDGGPIGGYAQTGVWRLDARFNRKPLIDRIRRIATYRERIRVTKLDAIELLKSLTKFESRGLVYLDPPYYKKGQRLYLNALEPEDHKELATYLLSDPPFRWVMTYDNVPAIRKLYSSCSSFPFRLSYSASTRENGREVMIIDPRLDVPGQLLRQHNRAGRLRF